MAVSTQQYVVVWEWLQIPSRIKWRPYSPAVSQILEKAYRSKLTQVLLGDADPALSKFRVSLTSMSQICEFKEEVSPVRRTLYPRNSPAGKGIRWDWLGDRIGEWIDYEMDAQLVIENAWINGLQTLDISQQCEHLPYILNFCNLTQVRKDTGFVRSVRRVQQASYPAALKNEMPEPIISVPEKCESPEKTTSHKGNWLTGIINVVKSPSKNTETKAANKAFEPNGNMTKSKTKDNSNRSRNESRSGLRLERRTRSSSLDTVSTCLSHDDSSVSLDKRVHPVKFS